jgi:hypothetical protein
MRVMSSVDRRRLLAIGAATVVVVSLALKLACDDEPSRETRDALTTAENPDHTKTGANTEDRSGAPEPRASDAGDSSCPETPCRAHEVCLTVVRGDRVSNRCIEDPCRGKALDCACAGHLCERPTICMTSPGAVTCATR